MAVNEAENPQSGVSASLANSTVTLHGVTTCTRSLSAGATLGCSAPTVLGGTCTLTISGTAQASDVLTITVNGHVLKFGGIEFPFLAPSAIAAIIFARLKLLISGDLLSFLSADKATAGTNSQTGTASSTMVDGRPTTTETVVNYAGISQTVVVVNDTDTSI